jgi:hypothetical protein
MLCYVMLCYVMLCCVVLCCVVLCCFVLCCVVLCCVVLCCVGSTFGKICFVLDFILHTAYTIDACTITSVLTALSLIDTYFTAHTKASVQGVGVDF